INELHSHIIDKARSGVKGNTVTGTYNMGRAVFSYGANQRVIGQHKRRLLSKYTFWKYTFDLKSDEMIRLEAIKKYASEENISITLGLVPCLRDRRGIEFDLSDFPTVTAISHGKHYGGSLLELDMADFSLMVHYSVSI
ncbi:MAG: hypothetical protein II290_03910, partial [Oscillospiraceae bacterium]|nr:hypothetical protein [Oscillospiraceae bacterium]